jgi:hypothetical protein
VHPDVMLVPLAAFDKLGHRIGTGKVRPCNCEQGGVFVKLPVVRATFGPYQRRADVGQRGPATPPVTK